MKAHGQSTAAVKDTDYTVDYADGLLAITLKGSLAAAESIDIIITRTLEGCVKIVPLLEGGGIPDLHRAGEGAGRGQRQGHPATH